ncbi:MAG: cation-transporting P-type ATPase [Bilophila wadsworthia]
MRALFGRNELARKKADSILKRLFKAFINPFTVVLIVLAVISSSPTTSSSSRRIAISPPFLIVGIMFSSAARCGLCRKCARATRRNVCRRWSRPPLRSCVTARAGNAPFRSLLWAT